MKKSVPFIFNLDDVSSEQNTFVARIPAGVFTKEDLLNTLARELHFPNYFGQNWDALADCLRDFDWIETRQVVLLHEALPQLNDDDLKTYIEILIFCVSDWSAGEKHELIVIFPDEAQKHIEAIIGGSILQ